MKTKVDIPLSKVIVDEELKSMVIEALESGWYILGRFTKEFENAFAKFCNVKHAIATSSGTSALFLSMLALGVKPGDYIIVPSMTFVSTATTVLHVGARPVFVDIDPTTYTMDPDDVRRVLRDEKVAKRARAIIPVHLYGHPANMDAIAEIAEEHGLYVIEDACQAHGAEYKERKVGSIGYVACFSFYPSKNMTVCGDGGMVTTNDDEVAEKIRMLRNHGRKEKYIHELLGYNMRFNEIQAAIGLVYLKKLPNLNKRRREIAKQYSKRLREAVIIPVEAPWAKHVYHMYVIRTPHRDELARFLEEHGIHTGIHYPVPIHRQPVIERLLGSQETLRHTEECARMVLSLPMHPMLRDEEVDYVCDKVLEFSKSITQ